MTYIVYPDFSSGGSGGGGSLTYPLNGPAGSASAPTFSVGGQGGLFSPSSGGVALASGGAAALLIDANLNVSLAANLAVAGSTTLQALQAAAVSVSSLTSSGNASIGGSLGVTMDASISGNLSAKGITASAGLTAASLASQGNISGQSLTIAGAASIQSLTVHGTFSADAIASTGSYYFPETVASAPGLALTDDHGTGVYGSPNHILGFSTNGNSVATFDASGAFALVGALAGQSATFQGGLTAATLASTGLSTLASLSVTGSTNLAGAAVLASDLTVQGTAHLATLAINTLNTQSNVVIGGTLDLAGAATLRSSLSVAAALTASAGLTVQGSTSLQALNAGPAVLSDLKLVLPQGSPRPAVATASQPGNTTINYSATLDNLGNLAISSDFRCLGAAAISGAVTAYSAALQAGFTAASATLSGALSALTTTIGGATFSSGQGNPTGQVTGSVGDVAIDRSGGLLYLKTSGAGTNTGWVSVSLSSTSVAFPLLAPDDSSGTAPGYSFASNSMRGMGYKPGLGVYLATAGGSTPAVALADNNGGVTINPAATFTSGLTAQATAHLVDAVLSAGAQVGGNLAVSGQTTLSGATTTQALTVQGALAGGAATLGQTTVSALSATSTISASAGISSQTYLAAPQVQLGATPAVVSAGTAAPNGSVTGSAGDLYLQDGAGAAWVKTTGTATTSGWAQVSTSATGTSFPLTAPDGSLAAPSYGFSQSALGLTATGSGALSAITGGAIGWTLKADKTLALAGGLTAAAASSFAAGVAITGTLSATGASTLAAVSATTGAFSGALSAASLSTTGDAAIGGAGRITGPLTAASAVISGTASASRLASGGSNWYAGAGVPASNTGTFGDIASDQTNTDPSPFYVRTASGWQAVALAGAPAPATFPLLAPADSATAPSYSWAASPKTGAFSPGTNRYGLTTNGVAALTIDPSQNVTLTAALNAQAATFASASISGAISAGGNAQFGGTLQVTGQSTLSGAVSSGALTSSGAVSGTTITASGLLSGNTLQTTSDAQIGGNLTVTGTTSFQGIQRSGYVQVGDGTQASPAIAFTAEQTTGIWRPGSNQIGFAANNASLLLLAPAKATFPATVAASILDASTVRSSGGTLALQGGTTTVLSLTASAISAAVPVAIPAGTTSAPGLQVGFAGGLSSAYDSRAGFPSSVSLTNPTGSTAQLISFTEQTTQFVVTSLTFAGAGLVSSRANPNGFASGQPGQLYQKNVGGSGSSLWVYEGTSAGNSGWASVLTSSSTITPTYPAVGPAGSASAPTFAVGSSNTGIFSGTDALSRAFLGLAQGGATVARLATFTNNSLPVFLLGLGDPTSSSIAGGVVASAQLPSTGAPAALPGMIFQDTRGGVSPVWVNESTTTTPSFAKVLTTSSPVAPTFPLLAPADSVTAPSYSWLAESGLGLSRAGTATLAVVGAGAQLAAFTTNLVTLPGALRIGGTNAGLTSTAANQLTLQTAGAAALSIAASGISTFAFQAIHSAGTVSAPGVAVGGASSGMYSGTDAFSQPYVALSVGSTAVARVSYTTSPAARYILSLGDPTSTSAGAGLQASTVTPVNNIGAFPSNIYQWMGGGAGLSLWVYEGTSSGNTAWARVLTSGSTQLLQGSGTASAPMYSFAAATGTGNYFASSNTQGGNGSASIAHASKSVSNFFQGTVASSSTYFAMSMGDPSQNATLGGLVCAPVTPVGNITGSGGQIYQWLNGGAAQSLWVYEGTAAGTSAWAKVLTSSSPVSPTFPIQAPSGTAASPTYSFSASTSTGVSYFADQGSAGTASVGLVAGGKVCAYSNFQTANSITVYNLILGDPSVNASPYPVIIRASAQAASGNIVGAPGQIALNNTGGVGTVLAVKETGVGTSTGWSLVLTTGTTQLANQNGTAAAPYYSFSGNKTSGLYYDGSMPAISHNGVECVGFATAFAGTAGYNGITFGAGNTAGIPYMFGVPSSAPNAGNPNTNALPAYQGALMINAAGAVGNQLWIHEPTTSTSGWVRVLTENTALSFSRLLQTTAPSAVTGQSLVYARTDNQIGVVTATNAGVSATLKQELAATVFGATATITVAQNGITAVATGATQYTLTLPATQTATDLSYSFQIEGAGGFKIQAPSGVTLYNGTSASTSGGTLTSTAVGSTITLFNRANSSLWFAYTSTGTWTAA